jgi:hypothetical protein
MANPGFSTDRLQGVVVILAQTDNSYTDSTKNGKINRTFNNNNSDVDNDPNMLMWTTMIIFQMTIFWFKKYQKIKKRQLFAVLKETLPYLTASPAVWCLFSAQACTPTHTPNRFMMPNFCFTALVYFPGTSFR